MRANTQRLRAVQCDVMLQADFQGHIREHWVIVGDHCDVALTRQNVCTCVCVCAPVCLIG